MIRNEEEYQNQKYDSKSNYDRDKNFLVHPLTFYLLFAVHFPFQLLKILYQKSMALIGDLHGCFGK